MTGRTERALTWGFLGLPVLGATVWISLHIQQLGFRIEEVLPSYVPPHLQLDYTMGLLWWSLFAFCLLAFGGDSRRVLLVGWIGKFFVALVAMLFYEYIYELDAFAYYHLSLSGEHDWFPGYDFSGDMMPHFVTGDAVLRGNIGQENTLRFVLMVAAVTGPHYHAMKVACAFLGFMGAWWFYRAAVVALGRPCPPVFYLLVFFPSILFWSSSLGKDAMQFFFVGLYAYGGTVWFVRGRLSALGLTGIGLMGTYLLRPWHAVMAGGVLMLATFLGRLRVWQIVLLVAVLVPLVFFAGGQVLSAFGLQDQLMDEGVGAARELIVEMVQKKASAHAGETERHGGSGVDFGGGIYESSGAKLISAPLPVIIFSGLFRPLPFDVSNFPTALAALENTLVLCLAAAALWRVRLGYLRDPLVVWSALYCLAWAALYGLFVMASFGTGVRYKLQMWPFILLLLLSLTHRQGRAWLDERVANRR